jgi:hypothetical protein
MQNLHPEARHPKYLAAGSRKSSAQYIFNATIFNSNLDKV